MSTVQSPATRWSWVEVNLAALRRNTAAFRKQIGRGPQMMCVVKADAYGHGAVPCAKTMHAAGANQFAVATVPDDEAFDETVHEVYQKGYKLGEKVLRPAMVTVTTGGPKRPKEETSEEE